MKKLMFAGVLAFGTILFFGCSAAENAVDCNGICTRYKSCFDDNYDTGSCEQRCSKNADSDPDFMAKATDCSNCIGEKSCASATFNCVSQCSDIVP